MWPAEGIVEFNNAIEDAANEFSKIALGSVSSAEVEEALIEVTGCSGVKLLDGPWTCSRVLHLLKGFDFARLRPVEIGYVVLPESAIPDGTPRLLTEQIVKAGSEVWHIHRNDADPFPSNPHAHNYESGLKLSLADGGLYRKKKRVGSIPKKILLTIRSECESLSLPPLDL